MEGNVKQRYLVADMSPSHVISHHFAPTDTSTFVGMDGMSNNVIRMILPL